jgi:hypothetical protein
VEIPLIDVCGTPHLLDLSLIDRIRSSIAGDSSHDLALSFNHIESLAPSFATELLLMVNAEKSRRTGMRVRLTRMSSTVKSTIERSRNAMGGGLDGTSEG